MGDGVNFTFNKGKNFEIKNFDGVSKNELIQKAGGKESQRGKLIETIFAKYDNGDGILTNAEYAELQADLVQFAKNDNLSNRELKRFNNNLGSDKNAYSMEDLQAVIGMMVDGQDSVTGVEQDGENLNVTYKPEEGGGTKTSTFTKGANNELILLSDSVVNGETTTNTKYLNGDHGKYVSQEVINGNTTTTTTYADDGTTISSRKRVTGTVTEELDPANGDRVTKKITNKGSGGNEIIEYTYNNDGSVTETHKNSANGDKPVKVINKTCSEVTGGEYIKSETEYTYGSDGTTTELIKDPGGVGNVRTVRDNDGKIQEFVWVEQDEDGNYTTVSDYTHTVEPGQTWYGIVQAKYGVTDHKTIMEIVHNLKDASGINYNSSKMPDSITLPGTITLQNGTTVNLKNTGALVSIEGVNGPDGKPVGPKIEPPQALNASDIPSKIAPLSEELQQITIPTFDVNTENANKTVQITEGEYAGKFFQYDENGRVMRIYDNEADKNAGNNSIIIRYDDQGAIATYQKNSFDESGHWTVGIEYDGEGKFIDRFVNDQFDPNHPKQYGRQTHYAAGGTVDYIIVNYTYDEQDRKVGYDTFNADGNWLDSRRMDYGNDGARQIRYYGNTDGGRMTSIEK